MAPWTLMMGRNRDGQLGLGDRKDDFVSIPNEVPSIDGMPLVTVCCTKSFTLALDIDGRVHFCGSAQNGVALNNDDSVFHEFEAITPLLKYQIVDISCSDDTCLALLDDGSVLTWGYQFDDDGGIYIDDATRLTGIPACSCIAAGFHFFAVVNAYTGDVWVCGENGEGQLGTGNGDASVRPVKLGGIEGPVIKVACGFAHTLALTIDGNVYAWGRNVNGQLGVGNSSQSDYESTPILIEPGAFKGAKIVGIACGGNHSLAWTSTGQLYTWGDHNAGRLGYEGVSDGGQRSPRIVDHIDGIVVSADGGYAHSVALTNIGEVYQWGGDFDALDRDQVHIDKPRKVDWGKTIELHAVVYQPSKIACGWFHTVIHGGPNIRPSFVPALPSMDHSLVQEVINTHFISSTKKDDQTITRERVALMYRLKRLKFKHDWASMAIEGTSMVVRSREAELDPIGGADVSVQINLGIGIGFASESTKSRVKNRKKGKAPFLHHSGIREGMVDAGLS